MWRWQWLAELAKEHKWEIGAELGVKEGRTTDFLSASGIAMIAVDLWKAQPNKEETYSDWDHEKYLREFLEAVRGRDVTVLRLDTSDAAKAVHDESLDFVFIDADHSYEGVKADIQNWTPKVKWGGAITGHDYNWESVRKAVDEAFSEIVEGPNNTWLSWK